jgi:glycosyltransferase involved in cell wall biosynthesis
MFRLWFPHTPVFYVPSYPEAAAVSSRARMAARYDLLFVGSENHFNVDGITAFLAANAAWLSRYRIALAGRVCAVQSVRDLAAQNANITLLGFVEDLEEVYGAAWAAISPVEGTGLKMKVVEALRYGKPVFASAHSANSLPPGSEGCVFPLNEASIARLFKNIPAYEAACLSALAYGAAIDGAGESEKLRALLVERMESSVRRAALEPHAVLAEAVL